MENRKAARTYRKRGLSGTGGCSLNWGTEQDGTSRISHPSTTEHKTDALTASATEVCRNELSHFEHRDLIFFNLVPS
jgi:hypothetical protein